MASLGSEPLVILICFLSLLQRLPKKPRAGIQKTTYELLTIIIEIEVGFCQYLDRFMAHIINCPKPWNVID
jgi:hypothetical protein